MTHLQLFPFRPAVKQRPRMTRRGKAYTPKPTLEFEQKVRDQYDGPLWDVPVLVEIELDTDGFAVLITDAEDYELTMPLSMMTQPQRRKHLRGDLDNYVKAIMDGLQSQKETKTRSYQAGAWDDDKIVVAFTAAFADLGDVFDVELAA